MGQGLAYPHEEANALEKKPPQIPSGLDGLDRSLDGLHNDLTELEARLSPLLRPDEETPTGSEPQEALVPMAEQVRAYRRRVEAARARINSIVGRLEI